MAGRILVVDDDSFNRRTLVRLLKSKSYFVQNADNGRVALSLINSSAFDAVITDFHLGNGIDGLDILNHFNGLFPEKCKILMSGTATDVQSRCTSIGALYFSKPVNVDALLISIEALVPKPTVDANLIFAFRQRSKELREKTEANRRRFRQLQQKSLMMQKRFQELTLKKSSGYSVRCRETSLI